MYDVSYGRKSSSDSTFLLEASGQCKLSKATAFHITVFFVIFEFYWVQRT